MGCQVGELVDGWWNLLAAIFGQNFLMQAESSHVNRVEELVEEVANLHADSTAAKNRTRQTYSVHEEQTVKRLQLFLDKVDRFDERFRERGPAAVGPDLDLGVELMKV